MSAATRSLQGVQPLYLVVVVNVFGTVYIEPSQEGSGELAVASCNINSPQHIVVYFSPPDLVQERISFDKLKAFSGDEGLSLHQFVR